MKKLKIILWLCMPLLVSSCLQEGNNTIVLNEKNPLDEVVPVETRFAMEEYMPIYNGDTPPNIEGVFLSSPMEVVFSSSGGYKPGDIIVDYLFKFSNQDNKTNMLSYEAKEESISSASSDDVTIIGSGKNFTTYFTTTGTSYNVRNKMAAIISGTITTSGIKDLYYAFVLLEKGPDPDKKMVEEGTYRIFTDSDGLAKNSAWSKSAIINYDGKSVVAR